jgi:hypothetical protein
MEPDICEKVLSGARDPRFGDKAAILERPRHVVEKVDDVIQYLGWEIRHRGFRSEVKTSALARLATTPASSLAVFLRYVFDGFSIARVVCARLRT